MNNMKIKIGVAALLFSSVSNAGIINGYSDVTSLGGGVYMYTFDTLSSDIHGNTGDVMQFSGPSFPTLSVSGGAGYVIQDTVGSNPLESHGGLGVDAGLGDPGNDNLAGDEWLTFAIGGATFDLVGITLNGDHSDCFASTSMAIDVTTDQHTSGFGLDAAYIDGCSSPSDFSPLDTTWSSVFADITYFTVDDYRIGSGVNNSLYDPFSGYVESITIRTSAVPEPSVLALLGLGLAGLGFVRRRKLQA